MAITYNSRDNIFYGTNEDRTLASMGDFAISDKFYEYDTKAIYITDGTTWYLM